VRFSRKAVALACVTGDAGANHVFPSRATAPVTWHHVIEIKIAPIEELAAILASVLVSLEYVVAREFYFLLWKPIEHQQHDHPRDADFE